MYEEIDGDEDELEERRSVARMDRAGEKENNVNFDFENGKLTICKKTSFSAECMKKSNQEKKDSN